MSAKRSHQQIDVTDLNSGDEGEDRIENEDGAVDDEANSMEDDENAEDSHSEESCARAHARFRDGSSPKRPRHDDSNASEKSTLPKATDALQTFPWPRHSELRIRDAWKALVYTDYSVLEPIVASIATDTNNEPIFILEEFKRFMLIKVLFRDDAGTIVSPTSVMDELWHSAVLNTKFYTKLMKNINNGQMLHHRTKDAFQDDDDARYYRAELMASAYRALFGAVPISGASSWKPRLRVTVFGHQGPWFCEVDHAANVRTLRTELANIMAVPLDRIALHVTIGRNLESKEYQLEDSANVADLLRRKYNITAELNG